MRIPAFRVDDHPDGPLIVYGYDKALLYRSAGYLVESHTVNKEATKENEN